MILELVKLIGTLSLTSVISLSSFSFPLEKIENESFILEQVQMQYPACFLPGATYQTCPFLEPKIDFYVVPENEG